MHGNFFFNLLATSPEGEITLIFVINTNMNYGLKTPTTCQYEWKMSYIGDRQKEEPCLTQKFGSRSIYYMCCIWVRACDITKWLFQCTLPVVSQGYAWLAVNFANKLPQIQLSSFPAHMPFIFKNQEWKFMWFFAISVHCMHEAPS